MTQHSPQARPPKRAVPGVESMVAISSGKGGVGKSTVCANLAIALARRGLRTGLLDADIYGPNIPGMLGLREAAAAADDGQTLIPITRHGLRVMSMGMLVQRGTPVIWRGPLLAKMIDQFLFGVQWGPLDVLLLDLPPGTGDVQITLTQSVPLTGAVIVTTSSDLSLADVRRGVEMFRQTGVPVLGLVENMSAFVCSQCGHLIDVFGSDGGQRLAAQFGLPLLARIPLDAGLRRAADAGEIFADLAPASPAAQAMDALAAAVQARLAHQDHQPR